MLPHAAVRFLSASEGLRYRMPWVNVPVSAWTGVVAGPSKHKRLEPSEDADALPVTRRLLRPHVRPEGRGRAGKRRRQRETKRHEASGRNEKTGTTFPCEY